MIRSAIFSIATVCLAISAPLAFRIFLPGPAEAQAESSLLQAWGERGACFAGYHFGSVHFAFTEPPRPVYSAGQTVQLTGTLTNTSDVVLPQGKVLTRVLRQDAAVADEQWHPYIQEIMLPEDYSVSGNATRSFTWQWPIPANAPAGTYRVEFFYLAGNRYVISGIPYAANFAAAATTFTVQDTGLPEYANFDRASVRLNGASLALRSVPPTLSPAEPVTITAQLEAHGKRPLPVKVTTALYRWSDSDGTPPVQQSTTALTLNPGTPTALPFSWNTPAAGVWELVLTATPDDSKALPSLLKVRFPVAGDSPRVIFSGVTKIANDQAEITTCAVNTTGTTGGGSVHTRLVGASGTPFEIEGEVSSELTSTLLKVPVAALAGTATIATEVRDQQGHSLDQHATTYSDGLLPVPTPKPMPPSSAAGGNRGWLGLAGVAVVALLLAIGYIIVNRNRPHGF